MNKTFCSIFSYPSKPLKGALNVSPFYWLLATCADERLLSGSIRAPEAPLPAPHHHRVCKFDLVYREMQL